MCLGDGERKEKALVGKGDEFFGERALALNPPSWALGRSWSQAFCLVPVRGMLVIFPQPWGCFSGHILPLAPFFLLRTL